MGIQPETQSQMSNHEAQANERERLLRYLQFRHATTLLLLGVLIALLASWIVRLTPDSELWWYLAYAFLAGVTLTFLYGCLSDYPWVAALAVASLVCAVSLTAYATIAPWLYRATTAVLLLSLIQLLSRHQPNWKRGRTAILFILYLMVTLIVAAVLWSAGSLAATSFYPRKISIEQQVMMKFLSTDNGRYSARIVSETNLAGRFYRIVMPGETLVYDQTGAPLHIQGTAVRCGTTMPILPSRTSFGDWFCRVFTQPYQTFHDDDRTLAAFE